MLFIVSWSIAPEHRNSAIARFIKTGGAPPEGVTMLGRWHAIGRMTGVAIAETSDASLMLKWVLEWSDLMSMDVHPALTDEQSAPLLATVPGLR